MKGMKLTGYRTGKSKTATGFANKYGGNDYHTDGMKFAEVNEARRMRANAWGRESAFAAMAGVAWGRR